MARKPTTASQPEKGPQVTGEGQQRLEESGEKIQANALKKIKRFREFGIHIAAAATCLVTIFSQIFTHHDLGRLNQFLEDLRPQSYPKGGIIATFQTSSASEVRTNLNEEISILSDCAKGGGSSLWYELIPHQPSVPNSDGFLRLHYKLEQKPGGLTSSPYRYVGVFSDFSNPVKLFDISAFTAVRLRLRLRNGFSKLTDDAGKLASEFSKEPIKPDQTQDTADCQVHFFLSDANVKGNGNYAWAEVKIEPKSIVKGQFEDVDCALSHFHTPEWSKEKFPFDTTKVFRFGIVIDGSRGTEAMGELDIDDIRFIP